MQDRKKRASVGFWTWFQNRIYYIPLLNEYTTPNQKSQPTLPNFLKNTRFRHKNRAKNGYCYYDETIFTKYTHFFGNVLFAYRVRADSASAVRARSS